MRQRLLSMSIRWVRCKVGVLDSATSCAVHSELAAGDISGGIDLAVKFIRPLPQDEILITGGVTIIISKSLGIAKGTLQS